MTALPETAPPARRVRAIGLLSGGLDSLLAACLVRDQGVEVTGLAFESPFFHAARARAAADQAGLPLRVEDFTGDILALVAHPPHGFGSGMNPCIDCHARMIRRAGAILDAEGYDFVFTGEILNQRPMSQNGRSLQTVARESGYADRLVRPLSALRLPETEVERRGLLDRRRLLGLMGRSRRDHLPLAARFGIAQIPAVAGGCCLAEPQFAARLRDLRRHEGVENLTLVRLLFLGRHFRLGPRIKCVVGRDAADNLALRGFLPAAGWLSLEAVDRNGPLCLLPDGADDRQRGQAAGLCAFYAKGRPGAPLPIALRAAGGPPVILFVPPAAPADLEGWRVT